MRKLLYTPWIALAFLLTACATSDQATLYERASQVCVTYKNTLNTLAGLRAVGELSKAQVEAVNDLRPLFAVCRPGGFPENMTGDWVALLDAALFELMLVEGSK